MVAMATPQKGTGWYLASIPDMKVSRRAWRADTAPHEGGVTVGVAAAGSVIGTGTGIGIETGIEIETETETGGEIGASEIVHADI